MTRTVEESIETIVAAMREAPDGPPYFMAGSGEEINKRLLAKDKNSDLKYKKYPLIALVVPFDEDPLDAGLDEVNLNIAILNKVPPSMMSKNAEERVQQVFKPILLPLYEKFLKGIRYSGFFTWGGENSDQTRPPHEMQKRPFWGTPENAQRKKTFTDPLDAIEILNLRINHFND